MKYQDKKEAMAALRNAVETQYGLGVNSPVEFKRLSKSIKESTGGEVSQSTLMRLWGYIASDVRPNVTTLDVLAAYAGYADFAAFCAGLDAGSDDVFSPHINVDKDLTERDHVLLRWQPGRELLVRYMGNSQFVVERSKLSKLVKGDTFNCHLIIKGHPLYLDNVVHESMAPRCYVCGKNRGVQYEVIPAED